MGLDDPRTASRGSGPRAGQTTRSTEEERLWPDCVCGVDIGGTFTDCVLIGEDGRVAYGKALSSPADSFQSGFFGAIESAGEQLGLDRGGPLHAAWTG